MKNFFFKYLFFIFYSGVLFAQNWTPFNPNYRYNYKIDSANVVTSVVFHDSSKVFIGDTVFYLNRVGRICAGSCPGFSIAFTPTAPALVTNMPQFMQRAVHKLSNGDVTLSDPLGYVFKPNCALNQSWIFETTFSLSASCVSIGPRNVFGTNDSIKTIVTSGADTIELSKSFGILRFPLFNSSHRYYKLVGIEASASYDSIALYGYKVPNAWDFYNYQVGDIFCTDYFDQSTAGMYSTCKKTQFGVISKTITPSSYTYKFDVYEAAKNLYGLSQISANCADVPYVHTSTLVTYSSLNSKSKLENLMYPGMVVYNHSLSNPTFNPFTNVISFTLDVNGVFYKAVGIRPNNFSTNFPQGNYLPFSNNYSLAAYYQGNLNQVYRSFLFSEKFGRYDEHIKQFELRIDYQKTCFTRNNINLFGNPYVGIGENSLPDNALLVYPNPFNEHLTIRNGAGMNGLIKITSLLGEEIFSTPLSSAESSIDLSHLSKGIYFLMIDTEQGDLKRKIIKE